MPVLRLPVGVQEAIERHLLRPHQRHRRRTENDREHRTSNHGVTLPFSDTR